MSWAPWRGGGGVPAFQHYGAKHTCELCNCKEQTQEAKPQRANHPFLCWATLCSHRENSGWTVSLRECKTVVAVCRLTRGREGRGRRCYLHGCNRGVQALPPGLGLCIRRVAFTVDIRWWKCMCYHHGWGLLVDVLPPWWEAGGEAAITKVRSLGRQSGAPQHNSVAQL